MISKYAVYGTSPENDQKKEVYGEFDKLETAMDFAEFYRRKYNKVKFQVYGITYNRTDEKQGKLISEWKTIPDQLREEAAADFIAYLQEDMF